MLLILVSWIYMFCIFFVQGTIVSKWLKAGEQQPFLPIVSGMMIQTLLIATAAFFINIGWEFYLFNLILTLCLAAINYKWLHSRWQVMAQAFLRMPQIHKVLFFIMLLTALLKCAQYPFILDNESYYLQSIKWLNEYGYVTGLANLNVNYAQMSPWHILQSGFNFSFLTPRLNDINGFLMTVFALILLNHETGRQHSGKRYLVYGVWLSFNVLLFQFINSPSPDFPLIILSQLAFLYYVEEPRDVSLQRFIILVLIYLAFVKVTCGPLILLILPLLWKRRELIRYTIVVALIFLAVFVAKNCIIAGYPLYPLRLWPLERDWTLPIEPLEFITIMVHNHEFLHMKGHESFTIFEKWSYWIRFKGINAFFNPAIISLFLLVPFTRLFQSGTRTMLLYFILLYHFVFIMINSPQFRFFLPEFVFLSVVLISACIHRFKVPVKMQHACMIIFVLLPLPAMSLLGMKQLTDNKHNHQNDRITASQLLIPEPSSKYRGRFQQSQIGNFTYFHPDEDYFFYASGDGPLPCTSKPQIQLMKRRFGIEPAMRTDRLKDGFKSVKVTADE